MTLRVWPPVMFTVVGLCFGTPLLIAMASVREVSWWFTAAPTLIGMVLDMCIWWQR